MAKKFGKLVLFSALAGAAAAGTYYYLQNKTKKADEDFDDLDDFDDFDEDIDGEDFSTDTTVGSKIRPYVPIDIDNAKEIIGEKVIETLDKTKERIEHFNVSEKIDKAKEFIGEMTSPSSEPVYTEMDMSAAPASDSSVSATYADVSTEENASEEFFDDSDNKE